MYVAKRTRRGVVAQALLVAVLAVTVLAPSPADSANAAVASGGEQVVYARSCARNDVQRALSKAPDGAVVRIPAGVCDWGSGETVRRPAGVWLQGAGRDKTIIIRSGPVVPLPYEGKSCTADLSYNADGVLQLAPCYGNPAPDTYLLEFDCSNGNPVEVSDLTLQGNDLKQTELQRLIDQDGGLSLIGGCVDFKVHDAIFTRFSDGSLTVDGGGSGVIYRNIFASNFKCQSPSTVLPRGNNGYWKVTEPLACLGYGVSVYGDGSWPEEATFGGPDAVFIENNLFVDNRHAIASNNASRYVVRYNNIYDTERARDFGIVDAHGRGSYSPGSRSWEVYRNTLIDSTLTHWNTTGIVMRGGDGVVWENTIPTTFAWALAVMTESDCDASNYPIPDQTRHANVWGNHAPGLSSLDGDTVEAETFGSECVQVGREVITEPLDGYQPFTYPHPLRSEKLF